MRHRIALLTVAGMIACMIASGIVKGQVLLPGEELRYKVKWGFLRLGTIVLRTEREQSVPDSAPYRLTMTVSSNPALQVINIREYNQSWVSGPDPHTRRYRGRHYKGDDSTEIVYEYEKSTHCAVCTERDMRTGTILQHNQIENAPPFVEGASLLYYARCRAHSGRRCGVPTIVGNEMHKTILDFSPNQEEVEVDGIQEPVRALRYTGMADWKGGTSAGLSGEFTGWVSDDSAAVPLRAEMSVLLGSITIELEKWNRPGWVPPTALHTNR